MLISSNNNKGEECIYVAERMYLEPIPIRKYPQQHKCKANKSAGSQTLGIQIITKCECSVNGKCG